MKRLRDTQPPSAGAALTAWVCESVLVEWTPDRLATHRVPSAPQV